MNVIDLPERDLALREDIRLLGRILGDTVRQQQGEAVFATVERIRQISIQFRRDDDEAARAELEATLNSLSRDRTIEVVRAFTYFSHLANIAEDQHNIRSARADERMQRSAARRHHRLCAGAREGRQGHARPASDPARQHPGDAGAHRASDRGAAQERARPRDGRRASARRARPQPHDAGGAGRRRGGAAAAPCSRCGRPACCGTTGRR